MLCMYYYRFGGTSTCVYTRTQARGATPELHDIYEFGEFVFYYYFVSIDYWYIALLNII